FKLWSNFSFQKLVLGKVVVEVKLTSMSSMYRVTRDGRLRELDAVVTLEVGVPITAQLKGEVKEGLFTPQLQITGLPGGVLDKPKLKPVEVSTFGSVLNPMHPVNKVPGLRAGQRWRLPKVDPMALASGTILANLAVDARAPQFLEAEVRTETL